MIRRTDAPAPRRGYVLYIVLVVVVVLTLVAYQYADAMASESAAATRAHDLEQAKANAVSGVYHAAGLLTDPGYVSYNLEDDPGLFAAQPVGLANSGLSATSVITQGDANLRRGGGRFTLFNLADVGLTTYTRYGLEDESRKININALILIDPVGNVLYDVLMKLPDMTEDVADAIVDWVDADETIRPTGAESDYYATGSQPYRCKNGPISTLEELLLVRGVTPDLLFGSDRNRNGLQDGDEASIGTFSRGWSEYLTCYGRELNVTTLGIPRIDLNNDDLVTLDAELEPLLGREVTDYILYYRISGRGESARDLRNDQVAAGVADLRTLVQQALDAGTPPRRRLTSAFTVLNTQIRLPAVRQPNGQQVTPIVTCPLNDPATLEGVAQAMLDQLSATDDYELIPRINVNSAPPEVLACLPGLDAVDVDAIITNRPPPGTDPTCSWLVTAAKLSPSKFKNVERFVCGRSGAFRVRSVGYFATPGGPVASCEAVIEVVTEDADGGGPLSWPRIVYFRDTTDVGRVFTNLPR